MKDPRRVAPLLRRRTSVLLVYLHTLLLAACVAEVDPVLPPGRVDIEPGVGVSVVFDARDGDLDGVALSIAPEAVTRAQTLQLYVPSATTPVFFTSGIQLRTPAVAIEPFDATFAVGVELVLPWYSFGETIEATDIRGFSGVGIDGIPNGLWRNVEVRSELPDRVVFTVTRGGLYWAGTLEADPSRTPVDVVGDPCFPDAVTFDACSEDVFCVVGGCLGELCAATAPSASACRPSAASAARFDCACRCALGLCQWVR